MRNYQELSSPLERVKAVMACLHGPMEFNSILEIAGIADGEEVQGLKDLLDSEFVVKEGLEGPKQKIWISKLYQDDILAELDVNRESVSGHIGRFMWDTDDELKDLLK